MYKKIAAPIILALVTALAFSSVAYAATDATSYVRRVGTIISIDPSAGSFKLALNNGAKVVIETTASTTVRGQAGSLAELATGMYVNVTASQLSNGHFQAAKVNVLKVVMKAKVTGWITAVDDSSFTITGKDGKSYSFHITANTTVSGQGVAAYSGLEAGMKVKVTYSNLGDSGLRATAIVVLKK